MSTPMRSVTTLAVGLSLFGVTGYLLYLLFKKDNDDDYSDSIPVTSMQNKLEVKIPKEFVRNVIGRNGTHIKDIERKSQTKINFKDQQKNEDFRVCIVRGSSENCSFAESLLHEFMANQPIIENKDLWVPRVATGRIIGRCGERVHYITQLSGAKIHVSPESENMDNPERRILIKGTKEQIETAISCIMEIVKEDADIREKLDAKLAKREPRGKPKSNAKETCDDAIKKSWEKLPSSPNGRDGHIEVYVSAAVSPSQFWLQIVGTNANELDQLVEEMSDYYYKPENKDLHIISDLSVGEIVAATFSMDEKWYRAEVIELKTSENGKRTARLYYVDYGDSEEVPITDVYELRTDFLRLRFQAIECYLAKVKPIDDDDWSIKAVDYFEEVTHIAQWKKLRARVNVYRDRVKISEFGRIRREGSPIPGVDLYDVNNEEDIDIGMQLVKQGYALLEESVNGATDIDKSLDDLSSLPGNCVALNGNSSFENDSLPESDTMPQKSYLEDAH